MKIHVRRRHHLRGVTLLELIVAAVIVSTMIGVAGPLILRCNRLWKDTHRIQLACDEVTDQLEQLVAMSPEERTTAMRSLTVSEKLAEPLPDARLQGEMVEDELGSRIILKLNWQRPSGASPVSLVRWINPLPNAIGGSNDSDGESSEGDRP